MWRVSSDGIEEYTYQYDFLDRLTRITQTGSSVTTKTADYTYNLNGGRTGATYKQSGETVSQSSWLYDVANHTTRITHRTAQDAAFADYQLTWDEGSNITRIISNDGQADYAYDLLGQLVGADYDFMADESYGYDANGNDENYTIGDDNVLVSDGSSTYEHDAEGNRISKTNATGTERELYTWDYRNRLTQVALQEYDTTISAWVTVQIVEYAYDYQNQLITRTVGTAMETFVYENNQAILQFSGNTLTDINLWGANVDELVAVEKPITGVIYWAYSDHLNSIRDVYTYDTATHVLTLENHLVYNAFGKITSSLNALNVAIDPILRNAYTGKYLDPITKLQTNLHRWYDPITHRWMSEDPISFDGGDTNLYRYVGNRVLEHIDPFGNKEYFINIFIGHYGGVNSSSEANVFYSKNKGKPDTYFAMLTCLAGGYKIPKKQKIPLYNPVAAYKVLDFDRAWINLNGALRHAEKLAKRICNNRRKALQGKDVDKRYPTDGEKVIVQIEYDPTARELFTTGRYQNSKPHNKRVADQYDNWKKTTLEIMQNSNTTNKRRRIKKVSPPKVKSKITYTCNCGRGGHDEQVEFLAITLNEGD